jgi:hypothetical protein
MRADTMVLALSSSHPRNMGFVGYKTQGLVQEKKQYYPEGILSCVTRDKGRTPYRLHTRKHPTVSDPTGTPRTKL